MGAVDDLNTRMAYAFGSLKTDYDRFSNTGAGELRVDRSSNPPQYPNIQLYINADWLGVVNPIAVPQLGSVQPNPVHFTSGQQGTAAFSVTNAGKAGALSVALPTCTPSASFTWQNNPNRNYNAGESYAGSFVATAGPGSYACSINAQSSGYVTSGQYNPTSTSFSMTVDQACTNSASPPRYRSPTASDPCRVVCPLDPAIAGSDVCAQSGLVYNAASCACDPKPDYSLTNTCPQKTSCDDGTVIGICNGYGQRCKLQGTAPVLADDATCVDNSNMTCCSGTIKPTMGKCPDVCPKPDVQCIPLLQKRVTTTSGSYDIKIGDWKILSLGGTQSQDCETDWAVLLFGGCIAGVGILALVVSVFILAKKKKR
jgi:hypothetical protein